VRFLAALLVVVLTISLPRPAAARIDSIVLHAVRVAFYSNKFVVTGDDDVRVSLSDGTIVTGRTFSMDLKLNRFIVAGGVTLTHGAKTYEGAAFAEFLDFRRGYFLPVLSEPDRWTFLDDDYEKPVLGREMPGDAFSFQDVGVDHPFILSSTARITPKTGVGFTPARIYTLGVYTPAPDYYQNFSANPNFAQNSLNGATADVPYTFFGSSNASTALHMRYDTTNKGYLGIEQHVVSQRSYAVFSINPLTRPQKQYNFLGSFKTPSQRFQVTTFDQVSSFQEGFSQPWSSSALENLQLTYALPNSYLQLTGNQYQNTLLAPPQPDANGALWYGDPGHPWVPNHPNNFQIAWIGADRRWAKSPINYRLRVGLLTAHDGFGMGSFNNTPYTSYWQHFVGFTTWTNPFRLTAHMPYDQSAYFQVTYDRQRTIVSSFPRYQDQGTLTATLSKQNGRRGSTYLSYVVSNQVDYLGALQQQFYPPTIIQNPYDGRTYPGYAAFQGLATSRDLQFAYNFTPTPYFSFSIQGDRHKDFPEPIPFYYGTPPWAVTARTQFRLSPTINVTVQRSYYFNFGNMGWSPTFSVQVGP
jgi:hypothetical protein